MVQTCCVISCSSRARKGRNISFHRFPADQSIREQWLSVLKISEDDLIKNKDLRVCSEHFSQTDDFVWGGNVKKLRKRAVPHIHLPELEFNKSYIQSEELHPIEINKCKICSQNLEELFSLEGNPDLVEMLESLGGLQIETDCPQYLCQNCEFKLRSSYEFQQIIKKAFKKTVYVKEEIEIDDDDNNMEQKIKLEEISDSEILEAINEYRKKISEKQKCVLCGFISENMKALRNHMTLVHKDLKDVWCVYCNIQVGNLTQHNQKHLQENLKCKFCGKVLSRTGHFIEHLQSHSKNRPFQCEICKKGYISERYLQDHLKSHLTTETTNNDLRRNNFCEMCDKKVRSLKMHLKTVHQSSDIKKPDKVLCNVCGKQIASTGKLKVHMRNHNGEYPYQCKFCDRRGNTRYHIIVHERTHTGEKPHVCNYCGKAFSQSSILNTHMKIHTGPPLQCNICPKRFCRPCDLRLHMQKHSGEKPFNCGICEQSFGQRSHLVQHVKIHTNERPHQCNYCDKAFTQNSSLKVHLRTHLFKK